MKLRIAVSLSQSAVMPALAVSRTRAMAPSSCPIPRTGRREARYSKSLPGRMGLYRGSLRSGSMRMPALRCSRTAVAWSVGPRATTFSARPAAFMASSTSLSTFPTSRRRMASRNSGSEAAMLPSTFHNVKGLPSAAKRPVWVMLKWPSGAGAGPVKSSES